VRRFSMLQAWRIAIIQNEMPLPFSLSEARKTRALCIVARMRDDRQKRNYPIPEDKVVL